MIVFKHFNSVLLITLYYYYYYYSHNTEKVIYFLLLERKRRRPALEDDTEQVAARVRTENHDPPRKRVDTCVINGTNVMQFTQISEGSPVTPRRQPFQ